MLAAKIIASAVSASADAKLYVDDVFSTYLFTTNGANQSINNGIDLVGKGGMVWFKSRTTYEDHNLFSTNSGNYQLRSNTSNAYIIPSAPNKDLVSYNSDGFTIGNGEYTGFSTTGEAYASWTFRKAAKFFDVVTYTGNGVAGRQIAHSLGVAPGMIMIKATSAGAIWAVYHRSTGNASYLVLNAQQDARAGLWNSTTPTNSVFTFGADAYTNDAGTTYVAYLFAHDTSSTGIIQCGSFTGPSTELSVNLGFEIQYLLTKRTDSTDDWYIQDVMRGMPLAGYGSLLSANTADAQLGLSAPIIYPTATGFQVVNGSGVTASGGTYIYMAIRRPNKPPTSGTQVYNAIAYNGTSAARSFTGVGFPPDMTMMRDKAVDWSPGTGDRLRGSPVLQTVSAAAEVAGTYFTSFDMDGVSIGASATAWFNWTTHPSIAHFFKRAPGFFDEVCYTGTGVARNVAHGLGVTPELVIVKNRNGTWNWRVYSAQIGNTKYLQLNSDIAPVVDSVWNNTTPTAAVFSLDSNAQVNGSSQTYVAYLFASKAGISKVGSYTGNGSSLNIECGFASSARFVLIKRHDSAGDWYVWDTARGIVTGNDPHLSLNTTTAEVTTDDSIDPYSPGFTVNQVAATNINVASATYIFLAIS